MRWPFRRTPSGKHALGAAVTAIPAGPVVPVHHLPVELPTLPAAPVVRDVVAAPPVTVPAQPVVTDPAPRPAVVPAPPSVPAQQPGPLVPAAASHLDPFLLAGELRSAPPAQAGLPVRSVDAVPPPVPVQPLGPARPLPVAPPSTQDHVRHGRGTRVELGFADGTIRMLDPDSRAARALSELVGELTRPNGAAPASGDGSATR